MITASKITEKELEAIEFPLHNIHMDYEKVYESEPGYYIGKYEISYELRVDASYVTCKGDHWTPDYTDRENVDITVENIQFGYRQDDAFELTDEQYEIVKNKVIKSLNII